MSDFNSNSNEHINFQFNEGAAPYTAPSSDPQPPQRKRAGLPFWAGMIIGLVIAAVVVVVMAAATSVFRYSGGGASGGSTSFSGYEEKLGTIKDYLDRYFLWDIEDSAIEEGLADGLMGALGDKYAVYYTPEEFNDLMESVSGEYAGIGVSIIMNDDMKVEVYKVFKNSPAADAGIHVGDLIIEANGETDFPELDDLVAIVRGEPGSTVDLVIDRAGEKIPMTITRAQVSIDTVSYRMLDNNIGYILIEEFDNVTVGQFEEALTELTAQGMEAVIFDLRNNPGGDYDTVVAMCDRVLPEGVIMTVKDKNGTINTENSDQEHRVDLPMAVLINANSASASEVFTGAIQDYHIATIVGEQSFGKGIVQSIFTLPDGSGIKFTTQEYYTPSGDSINGVGITPDIVVTLPDDVYEDGVLTDDEDTQLQAAIEALMK